MVVGGSTSSWSCGIWEDAECKLRNLLIKLIHDKQQVIIDFSFWDRALKLRNKRFDANFFPISEEL